MNQMQFGEWAPELNKSLSQFHTPMKLCRRIAEWCGIGPQTVAIEPSAGGGNFVRAMLERGARHVWAYEIDRVWCSVLSKQFMDSAHWNCVSIINQDFMSCEPRHDVQIALMNPPLTNGVAASHVAHALNFAPRAVSIMRSQDMHGVDRYDELWSKCDLAREVKLVRRPKYAGAGGKIETVIVDVYKKGTYDGPQSVEWWTDDWS